MNTKSLLIGAALVILGGILGFLLSTSNCCSMQQCNKQCPQQQEKQFSKCGKEQGAEFDGHKGRFHKNSEEMFKKLNLSPEQKSQIEKIMDQKRENMKAEREKTHEAIKALLTPEQQTKFDECMKNHCNRMAGNVECEKPCCKKMQ